MLQFKVYDMANQQIQTFQAVNAEFFVGLILGALAALCCWNMIKGGV